MQHKNKNSCHQKQPYIDNLNTDVVKKDLNQLFGIRFTKYLQGTCSIKMPVNQKTGSPLRSRSMYKQSLLN